MKRLGSWPIVLNEVRFTNKILACDVLFMLDFPYKPSLENFKAKKRILIDHHVPVFKPPTDILMIRGKKPTCVLVWEELQDLADLDDLRWLVAIGSAADKCACFEDEAHVSREELKWFISLISSAGSLGKADVALNSVIEAAELGSPTFLGKTPNSKRLIKFKQKVEHEVNRILHGISPDFAGKRLVVYHISSSLRIQGYLAGRLKNLYPKKVTAVANAQCVDFRTDLPINLVNVLKKCGVQDFGGHPKAAGCTLAKGEEKEFFVKLQEELEKTLNK
jgi:single-stranded DNA-specific DHH superfamily exonuclease